MSMPSFPVVDPPITRENAVNQILSSIAMEELALSHILNAEGEKLQYILGTLPGQDGSEATIQDVLKANESVQGVLNAATEHQMFLRAKLEGVLSAPCLSGDNVTANSSFAANTSGSLLPLAVDGTSVPLPNAQILNGGVTANAANTVFTVPEAGLYRLSYSVHTTVALVIGSRLIINGAANTASTVAPSLSLSTYANEILVDLPAGSTISLQLYGLVAAATLLPNASGASLMILRLS